MLTETGLQALVKILTDNPNITIEISAHTDFVGNSESNRELSAKRAQSVVDYLIKAGITPNRLTSVGYGEENPFVVDASTAGKEDIIAANPDVIFVVYMPYAGDDPETVKESQLAVIKDDKALQSLDAVKNGRVYPIMLSEMYASATRTQDGIETFAKGLYPDVNLD